MPEPDGPQFIDPAERAFANRHQVTYAAAHAGPSQSSFDRLWTATYSPTGGNTHPNPRAAQRVYDYRQDFRRYGNRYSELSELGQHHVNAAINRLASHGGGHHHTGLGIASILRDDYEPEYDEEYDEEGTAIQPEAPPPPPPLDHNDRDAYGRSWEVEAGTSPDYDQPDPFDRSDPEQDRQAQAIEDMNELWEE